MYTIASIQMTRVVCLSSTDPPLVEGHVEVKVWRVECSEESWCKRYCISSFIQCTVFIWHVTIVSTLVDISRHKTFRTVSINTIVQKIRHGVSEMCLYPCVGRLLSTSSYFAHKWQF